VSPRHTHSERKVAHRQRVRTAAKAAKAEPPAAVGVGALAPARCQSRPVELTAEQVVSLRKLGLRSPAFVAPWLAREVAARPPERYRGREAE
jgi:hypothetical protein